MYRTGNIGMLNTIALKCPNCGSNLEVTADMEAFACGYCGASQVIERRGGTVSLRLVADAIKSVQIGTDKTAAELALKRLAHELEAVEQEIRNTNGKHNAQVLYDRKMYAWLWIIGIGVCFFIGAGGGPAVYFAFLCAVLVTGGIIYVGVKQDSAARTRLNQSEQEILGRRIKIQKKIDQNRKFVNS